ncbi:hypothetical protein B0H13DRAFT_1921611 [Mycena leptocephala]|nr:hypothetical protein B0H13DRAFT_1921611 [Mycena leptocephala]
MQFAILFSPITRVYNLRFLLVLTVAALVYWIIQLGPDALFGFEYGTFLAGIVSSAVIILHQVICVFTWRIRGLAAIDLAMLAIEIGMVGYLVHWAYWIPADTLVKASLLGLLITEFVILVLSGLFRSATVLKSKDKFFHQQFYFLGGCTPVHPPYRPLSILLNRSLSRPLIRGESTLIIFSRSVILSCVVLGATAFAIYTILVMPMFTSQPYLKNIGDFIGIDPQENATLFLLGISTDPFRGNEIVDITDDEIQARIRGKRLWLCNLSETDFRRVGAVWVWLQQEAPPLILLRNSKLFGQLFWTERRDIKYRSWSISPVCWISHGTDLLLTLNQSYNRHGYQKLRHGNRIPQIRQRPISPVDVDELPGPDEGPPGNRGCHTLSGIARLVVLGFVNGAFALTFGANVLYFAFGECQPDILMGTDSTTARRPLSALGLCIYSSAVRWFANGTRTFLPFIPRVVSPVLGQPASLHSSENVLWMLEMTRVRSRESQRPGSSTVPETLTSTGGEMREANRRTLHPSPNPSFTSRESEYLLGAGYRLDDIPFPPTDADVPLLG